MHSLKQVTVLGATYRVSKAPGRTGCMFCSEEAARRVVIVRAVQAAERHHRMWRIEEAAVFCESYLRGFRWWDVQVILVSMATVWGAGCRLRTCPTEIDTRWSWEKNGSINQLTICSVKCQSALHNKWKQKQTNYQIPPQRAWSHNVWGRKQ